MSEKQKNSEITYHLQFDSMNPNTLASLYGRMNRMNRKYKSEESDE